jgi:hypothetical protein
MHELKRLFAEKIATGLKRQSVTTPASWAKEYRVMSNPFPGKWTFKYHPWLKEMHETKAEKNIGQKAAQTGFTEWALNMTFFKIDIEDIDCLYILPSESDASDFSSGRFDPALELSPHLRNLFSDVRNVGHKRAGQNNLYVRGSRSRSKLKSIPCGFLVFDEVDEMLQANITLAQERGSGQQSLQVLMISTPTLDDFGINKEYKASTQEHFMFKCPHCSRRTEFVYPDCLVITADKFTDPKIHESYYICKECGGKLPHFDGNQVVKHEYLTTGIFVPSYSDRDIRGFTVNQMYSSAVGGRPGNMAVAALKSELDPTEATEFHNSKLGITYEAPGSRVTDTEIENSIKNYTMGPNGNLKIVTMGVDVGKLIHFEIDGWYLPHTRTPGIEINDEAHCRLLYTGHVEDFNDLHKYIKNFGVWAVVIDRHPETRMAYQFATKYWGRILLCMYARGVNGKQIHISPEDELMVQVDRTSWLDLSLGRFRNRTIDLPKDVPSDYRKQIKEPVRVYGKDADGNPVSRYVSINDDHYAHARNYSELALPLAMSIGQSQDLEKVR